MFKTIIGFVIYSVMLLVSGCVIIDAQDSCRARGGTWTEFNAIGAPIWPGRCVGALTSHKDECDRISNEITSGSSYQKLPSYCEDMSISADKTRAPKSPFIRKQDVAAFPKLANQPTPGESYLMDTVSPFLCEIVKSDKPVERLKSMGILTWEAHPTPGTHLYIFKMENFEINVTRDYDLEGKNLRGSKIELKKNSWPYTQDELISWLFSRGFKVLLVPGDIVKGVAEFDDLGGLSFTKTFRYKIKTSSYKIVFSEKRSQKVTPTKENSETIIYDWVGPSFSWQASTSPGNMFCGDN